MLSIRKLKHPLWDVVWAAIMIFFATLADNVVRGVCLAFVAFFSIRAIWGTELAKEKPAIKASGAVLAMALSVCLWFFAAWVDSWEGPGRQETVPAPPGVTAEEIRAIVSSELAAVAPLSAPTSSPKTTVQRVDNLPAVAQTVALVPYIPTKEMPFPMTFKISTASEIRDVEIRSWIPYYEDTSGNKSIRAFWGASDGLQYPAKLSRSRLYSTAVQVLLSRSHCDD